MRTSPSLAPLLALLLAALTLSGCVVAPRYDSPDGPRYRRPPPAQAQAPAPAPAPMYFYPMRNQSEAQQERDRYECYRWAVHQSGIDPGMTPHHRPARRQRRLSRGRNLMAAIPETPATAAVWWPARPPAQWPGRCCPARATAARGR
jgi:hypothetical protein